MFDRDKLLEIMRDGRIVGVTFTKRDGSLRHMSARLGVQSYLKGGKLAYDPAEYHNIIVFDMNKKQYRSIPCDRVHEIRAHGKIVYKE